MRSFDSLEKNLNIGKKDVIKLACIYMLKGLSIIVGFAIAGISLLGFLALGMVVGVICGMVYGVCEATYNLKELKDKFFSNKPNILDDYYEIQRTKDLKSVMDISCDMQDYIARNNAQSMCKDIRIHNKYLKRELETIPTINKLKFD